MRKMLILSAACLGLAAAPAFAQSGSTQTPPSPNASSSAPQSANSLPAGSATMNQTQASGGALGAGGGATGATQGHYSSGSTNNAPSGAFQQTVPQPATR